MALVNRADFLTRMKDEDKEFYSILPCYYVEKIDEVKEAGNAKVGKDIRLCQCKNCVVHAADERKVVVQGLDGYIVAEKNGQLLVCSLKEEQKIKEFGK